MEIKIITNSCFLISSGRETILVDPCISKELLKSLSYDFVLVSHAHIDHALHLKEIKKPIIGTKQVLIKEEDICIDSGLFMTGEFEIIPVSANHPHFLQKLVLDSLIHSLFTTGKLLFNIKAYGFIIKTKSQILYYSGDTSYQKSLLLNIKEMYKPDICLIAFEHFKASPFNLLIPMEKYGEIQSIFHCPVIPVHQTRKWYKNNLNNYLNKISNISL